MSELTLRFHCLAMKVEVTLAGTSKLLLNTTDVHAIPNSVYSVVSTKTQERYMTGGSTGGSSSNHSGRKNGEVQPPTAAVTGGSDPQPPPEGVDLAITAGVQPSPNAV